MNSPDTVFGSPLPSAALPEMRNHTRYPSQYFQMLDIQDQVFHVVASRVTYDMRRADTTHATLLEADAQTPLCDSDAYYGEVNESSVIQESDFAPYKPKCDVIFAHAVAHAPAPADPHAAALERFLVSVRIGDWQKRLAVTGARTLRRRSDKWVLADSQPVTQVPIRYEYAFGGTNQWPQTLKAGEEAERLIHYGSNPIGRGFADSQWLEKSRVEEIHAPQIEVFDEPFTEAAANRQDYPSVGLGAVGRWWLPRRLKAGTYDQAWKETRWPRLPKDFDFGYWNCAPEDQQIAYPEGGEEIVLENLHAASRVRFCLPKSDLHLRARLNGGPRFVQAMKVDTVIFDMQAFKLILVHRLTVPAGADVRVLELGVGDGQTRHWENPPPQAAT